jgi:hypothetical protein
MQKAAIVIGEEYGLREALRSDAPLQRVRVLEHMRGKKWKVEWIEPNPGLVDFVEAQSLIVRWGEAAAFMVDEKASRELRADNERNDYDDDSPVAGALYSVFDNIGDKLSFYRGILSGSLDALACVRRRARLEPSKNSTLLYVDRNGVVHAPFTEALELGMALCAAEPATALTTIEPAEKKFAHEASATADGSMSHLLNERRAAWALIRQWASLDPSAALSSEIDRLRRLVLDAVCALQRAGLDQAAHRLRQELGEVDEGMHGPKESARTPKERD